MRKFLVLCAALVFLTGCAEERKFIKSPFGGPDVLVCQAQGYFAFSSLPYNVYRNRQTDSVPFPGFIVTEAEGKVVIDTIIGGQNVFKELRRDDQVVAVNGKTVKNKKHFLELIRGERYDEMSYLTFRRYTSEFSIAIRLSQMNMSRMYTNLEKKLLEGAKVSVAIIPSANTTTTSISVNVQGLIENDKAYIASAYEKMFITEFNSYPNFSVIDRNIIEKIINEQKFQISGAVDDATIQKLGKIIGASNLFFITMSRYEDSTNFVERLVEVETARVAYSDNYTYVKPKPVVVVKKKKGKGEDDDEEKKDKKKEEKQPLIININNVNTNTNVISNTNINTNNNNNSSNPTINISK
ncbi:MAG: hypothetical protein A2452_03935 [Candidatus Firestonebacteria bacterium RIFOXYC2_FULL_39_67]|nr:MAG: hypothetical protein A2536_08670 [Candidatus Firestonebacteria bacterium RIFOXYD2_FULL_39_29]OGF54713.1 MAG: hypothetical protein A2452_03935 [Candidatus Firestonebacteria bacterium RIFOXYC2_FULL_39_67]OGF57893.1 MAG: hypothetical protein A2497_04245 [Candidatus Firestonebacteria bacterium RifOxyC12_full_39_7]